MDASRGQETHRPVTKDLIAYCTAIIMSLMFALLPSAPNSQGSEVEWSTADAAHRFVSQLRNPEFWEQKYNGQQTRV